MRLLVLLLALAMPLVAWLDQSGTFGPDNGTVSNQYPTLLVAAGYAFIIWGAIFLLDVIHGIWQATGTRKTDDTLARTAPWTAAGFALTAAWMPLFSMGARQPALFWVCLLVIFGAAFCLTRSALILSRDSTPQRGQWLWAWTPLSLHAGWLTLAAFLNLAQVIVAFKLLPTDNMLPWSLVLMVLAAIVLLVVNRRMRGNIDYAFGALWGLFGVHVLQHVSALPGARTASMAALAIAVILLVQTAWLTFRRGSPLPPAAPAA